MRVAINRPAVVQDHDHVGDAVVVVPALAAVADVGPLILLSPLFALDHFRQDAAEVAEQFLVRVGRHRRHDVHPLPDLIMEIDALALALRDELVNQSGIADQQPGNHPSPRCVRYRRRPSRLLYQTFEARTSPLDGQAGVRKSCRRRTIWMQAVWTNQNKKYLCAIGNSFAGSEPTFSPSTHT
jgi:hypothetical protein